MATTAPDTASTRHEIARARQDMGRALFLIADRLAPKKLIPRVKEQVKGTLSAKAEELKHRLSPARIVRRKLNRPPRVIESRGYESGLPPADSSRALPR
jgi:hypothetical protein